MRILVLSFYYQPDLCAGSFRTSALIEKLRKKEDVEVDVITTLPNRYASFSTEAPEKEESGNVNVHRVSLPTHNSGMIDQAKAFTSFYRHAYKIVIKQDYDMVYATSSRLFTAFLGARIANKKKLPLYLDIRDIFVDTIKDVLPQKITWLAKPILTLIERYTFGRAQRINLVSEGFREYFQTRYTKPDYRWFTNGIDEEFLADSVISQEPKKDEPVNVLYAGNMGEGQGLHTIVPGIAKAMGNKIKFTLIGDGGRKDQLEGGVSGLKNVELLPPVDRKTLIEAYKAADVLFLHLNDYPAFEKVLPSKIFEYGALGKPIWAGVSGYSAQFIETEVVNHALFHPGDAEGAVESFSALSVVDVDRVSFKQKFSRNVIMNAMADDLVEFGKNAQ